MPLDIVPKGYHSVTPYLVVPGVAKVIDFLLKTFDAKLKEKHDRSDGSIMHAEVIVEGSPVMMGEPSAEFVAQPTTLYVYVRDCDATYRKALAAGGVSVRSPEDQFYGDRHGAVKDPGGNTWWITQHIEDVTPEEMEKRAKAHA